MIKVTKKGDRAWVTFVVAIDANEVILKGSWNNWTPQKLKKRKNGTFSLTKILKPGEYQFGYLVDGKWMPDPELAVTNSPFGTKNSLLKV